MKEIIKSNLTFILTLVAIFVLRSSFADQYVVPSGSMLPTIHIGDRIYTNKMAYELQVPFTDVGIAKTGDPQRGDIVVFEQPRTGTIMVKRLMGLPGDVIYIEAGEVSINGQKIPAAEFEHIAGEFFNNETIDDVSFRTRRDPYKIAHEPYLLEVPADEYFFMGDNRENSNDSRVWGTVPRKKLLGKALRITFSANILQWPPDVALHRFGKSLYKD